MALKKRRGRVRHMLCCIRCRWIMSAHRFPQHLCKKDLQVMAAVDVAWNKLQNLLDNWNADRLAA